MVSLEAPHLSPEELLARVQWSAGTCLADAADAPLHDNLAFEPGGRVARLPWQSGFGSCRSLRLSRSSSASASTSVAVVKVPPDVIAALRRVNSTGTPGRGGAQDEAIVAGLSSFVREMPGSLGWRLEGQIINAGVSSGPTGLSHTTINTDTRKRVGLHFDSWDRLAPLQRHRGTNRLCINIGQGPRHLLFVAKPASVVVEELASRSFDVLTDPEALRDSTGRLDLARRYLEVFPEEPVLRVRMLSGEAYIAPTENLIHDGSSDEAVERDLSVTLRGFFVPTSEPVR